MLSADSIEATEITTGTWFFRLDAAKPMASLDLRVDHSFVSVRLPTLFGHDYLRDTLQGALPEGYLVLASLSKHSVVITFARAFERSRTPELFCTSLDARLRVRTVGRNNFVLRGVAHGRSELLIRIDHAVYRLALGPGETALRVAFRVRDALSRDHSCLITNDGEVTLTVLPRR